MGRCAKQGRLFWHKVGFIHESEGINPLSVGFAGSSTERREGAVVDQWELRVGRFAREWVVVAYDEKGAVQGFVSTGPTFR
jgi:hypothetical protein